jgi:ADP-ribosylglycohydrolase
MSPTIELHERLAGAVWGHLVGDAVGVPYEFRPATPAAQVVFGAKGTWHQPPGTWSDDGALMLALLDSMLTAGFDTTDQARRALEWYRGTAYTPDGNGRFDVGTTTGEALRAFGSGTPAEDAGPTHEQANGNGSLMRILPLALFERDVPDAELAKLAHRASRVTHGTVRAQTACALYSILVRRLLAGSDGRAAAIAGARRSLRDVYEAGSAVEHIVALDHLEAYAARGGRGRVWDSFWSAWDAFAGAIDYRETIQRAVAYGNDTDTTAAIAGGLAGIRWGIGGLPVEWLSGMRGREVVEPLVNRLAAGMNPIRVDWVDLKKVPGLAASPGRLGMTFLPGKHDDGSAGKHRRDLVGDVRWLRDAYNVDAFVLLVGDDELHDCRVPNIADVMATHGIDLIRDPIHDGGVPADRAALRHSLDGIRARLANGENIAVACRGGLGRTGTVVGCLLRDGGLDVTAAIALTRASRKKTIENIDQERFVEAWGER